MRNDPVEGDARVLASVREDVGDEGVQVEDGDAGRAGDLADRRVDRVHAVADVASSGGVEDHLVGQRLAAAAERGPGSPRPSRAEARRRASPWRPRGKGPEGPMSGTVLPAESRTGWPVAGLTTTGGMAFANGAAVTSGMVAVTTVAPVETQSGSRSARTPPGTRERHHRDAVDRAPVRHRAEDVVRADPQSDERGSERDRLLELGAACRAG